MQTIRMGSHIRDFAWLGKGVSRNDKVRRNRERGLYSRPGPFLQSDAHTSQKRVVNATLLAVTE